MTRYSFDLEFKFDFHAISEDLPRTPVGFGVHVGWGRTVRRPWRGRRAYMYLKAL